MALPLRAASSAKSPARSLPAGGAAGGGYGRIALTMVVTFVLSFAYLYRKQRAEELLVAPSAPPVIVSRAARPPPPNDPPARTVEPAPLTKAMTAPPAAAPNPTGGVDQAPVDFVPVVLLLRRDHRAGRVEGSIRNLSEQPLTLTIVTYRNNDETGGTRLVLDQLEKTAVGTDKGMEIESGDHIVIQSQGFKDRESIAP
ncbi:MAG TPA: hypothetical protein VK437_13000 [Steroidobacteraceae bacterium]|nr:hypothetical protein [Steroidobacteraceae bacterium]